MTKDLERSITHIANIYLIIIILISFISVLILKITTPNTPEAIDVYRGKTTLQITYQDSIPIDSVVIFK